ncbi:MAG TPA: glutathione peroxidase [Vulgatibacter sp.]
MRNILLAVLALALVPACTRSAGSPVEAPDSKAENGKDGGVVIDHVLERLDGGKAELANYRGKVMLLVNVASECGYTPQYEDLEKLYRRYKDRGLVVIGLPSNDFGGQEPGSAEEIRTFCDTKYGITFPMMAKLHAKGPNISPLYETLTKKTSEPLRGEVRWNFTKFLVDTKGVPVARFDSKVKPLSDELVQAIEGLLPTP